MTWQDDPTTTVTISVHGIKTPRKLTLYCNDQAIETIGQEMPLPDRRLLYHFNLRDLKPGTHYVFRVEGVEGSFTTLLEHPPYRFLEGGDWENTKAAEELALIGKGYQPDAILLGGDYPSNVRSSKDYRQWDRWLDVYAEHFGMTPFVMAIGNHEVVGGYNQPKEQAPFFFHYFRTKENPESYYTLALGKEHQLYVLDSGHAATHREQLEWLKSKLDTPKTKIALYHVPLFPSIRFADKGFAYRLSSKGMELLKKKGNLFSMQSYNGRKYWLPLFKKYQLDLAFEHHDQTLKRTKALGGTVYLGDGGWGCERQFPPLQGYFHSYFATLKGKQHFFWLLDIRENAMQVKAISKENKVLDSVFLLKSI